MVLPTQQSLLFALFAGLASSAPTASSSCDATKSVCAGDNYISLPINGGIVNVATNNLEVNVKTTRGCSLRLTNGIDASDSSATQPSISGMSATWSLPSRNCSVTATADKGRLHLSLSQPDGSNVTWPITGGGVDERYTSLQYPRGPGRNIPLKDKFWNEGTDEGRDGFGSGGDLVIAGDTAITSNWFMPFWGYSTGDGLGAAYYLLEDIKTTASHSSVGGSLQMSLNHEFSDREDTGKYDVVFEVTDGSLLAPAFAYRKYLQETGQFTSMKDKIKALPDTARLLGAYHAYGFGNSGVSVKAMKDLAAAGIKKFWIGYDGNKMTKEAVNQAQSQGYLAGPYDTYANGQPRASADTDLAKWPGDAFPKQCIITWEGKMREGFHHRGCYMSTQAQAMAEASTGNLAQRLKNSTDNGVKSYFLDVDAAGELFPDFSNEHKQNMKSDRKNRLDRMMRIAKQFVLGSEDPHGWANPAVAYGHGSLSIVDNRAFTSLMNITSIWGNYAPANGPSNMFRPVEMPSNFVTTMFDSRYMLPLTEAVLHDAVVNVDRWDLPLYKTPALVKQRVLTGMLYNAPMMYAINGTVIEEKGEEMAKHQNFFQPLHETGGLLPLTKFSYLTEDKLVQCTEFGSGELVVTANFGDKKDSASGLGGMCVKANLKGKESTLCV